MANIRVRPATLRDARDHALMSLPPHIDTAEAEVRAERLTLEYLERVQDGRVRRWLNTEGESVVVRPAWREKLVRTLDPVSDAVLRLHYGDGVTIEQVHRTAAIDASALEAAKEGLRLTLRSMLVAEDVGEAVWTDAKLDDVLARVANLAAAGCPSPLEILSEQHRLHIDDCPRCARAVRLVRGGVIAPSDLQGNPDHARAAEVLVGALILHPEARRVRKRLERAMGEGVVRAGPDVWLMSRDELARVGPSLVAMVGDGVLPRHHLRGAVVRGPGRWSGPVLLGPTALEAIASARGRPWSEIDTLGELPPPRPAPPAATRWWVSAALLIALTAFVGFETFKEQPHRPEVPLDAQFTAAEDGWEIVFDIDDFAVLDIVSLGENGLSIAHGSVRADRGQWATGGGRYKVYVPDAYVALVGSANGLDDLEGLIERARVSPTPWQTLETTLLLAHPTVAWVGSPAIVHTQDPSGNAPEAQP